MSSIFALDRFSSHHNSTSSLIFPASSLHASSSLNLSICKENGNSTGAFTFFIQANAKEFLKLLACMLLFLTIFQTHTIYKNLPDINKSLLKALSTSTLSSVPKLMTQFWFLLQQNLFQVKFYIDLDCIYYFPILKKWNIIFIYSVYFKNELDLSDDSCIDFII